MTKELKKIRKETKNIVFNTTFGVLNLVFVAVFYKNILLTGVILIILTCALILYYRRYHLLITVFIFCMIFGALAEIFAVNNGVWAYTSSDFFHIPIWLFILWGNAGLFIYRSAIEFERLGLHEKKD
ncbi:MAG TPA: hypothetical protein VL945_02135 [Candidatus Saccharimonadales bacterium]|nr:hypothetical protein [Candidatus Saccharimonadales bacterium]